MIKYIIYGSMCLFISNFTAQDAVAECSMEMNFTVEQSSQNWRAVNDGVMGGRSSGGPSFEDGYMVFAGVINTNGGGFSSIRTDIESGLLNEASGLTLRVKSDGRAYKVTFRTNARYRFRPISFQAEIPPTETGKWECVTVPFEALSASVFGRSVKGAVFDKSKVEEFGIILADGQDGPFRLELDRIETGPSR